MGQTINRFRRNDELIKIVGNNIRRYRKLKGLTIAELSFFTQISEKQIGDYENGKVDTNITMLSILAKHLDKTVAALFEGE
ncbi:transcriptional regulator with XRE-family HTH domain [Pedobacter cryoconitis]|uniref:Transcriptional regulator with XRE-family HTH domain n=1 Tax=Pedobacter cryoconitis TaxID=188932 RepID=A0A7W9DWZ2_9SPHI|nr:helix-turn-helix transcriptional regulator [Pedobacter cryoconitis]MBB5634567.1 transcriptional regulator with XRE-family HTH domain [Pedobacter cryoconitis]MBB6272303.1 transcriptional regulator with XRE-family HTH domain [Pedobacter cryoconitis]